MSGTAAPAQPKRPPLWQGPLVVGLCFGLGYGITQRLLGLGWSQFVQLGQGFEVRAFPGTSLESLRLRFGSQGQPVKPDLERQQAEEQQRQAAQQAEQELKRQEQQLEAERQQEQESFRRELEAAPAPSRGAGLVEPPPPPVLPPPSDLP